MHSNLIRTGWGLLLAALLWSCSSAPAPKQVSREEQKSEYQDFAKSFQPLKLPYTLPEMDEGSLAEIDKKYIQALFTGAEFKPALGEEKDVPDLADNVETAKYFYNGKIKGDGYDAYIIHKQDEADYYYLCTFSKDGVYKDGMCISFVEGTEDDRTQRTASLNDDQSIEIRQVNIVDGHPDASATAAHFYQIDTDGSITNFKDSATPQAYLIR